MFNNANVLFRTRFVEGTSRVSREVQEQQKAPSNSPADKDKVLAMEIDGDEDRADPGRQGKKKKKRKLAAEA